MHNSTKDLSEILTSIGKFSGNDVLLFEKEAIVRSVNKGEDLLIRGNISQSVFLIESGAAYQFEYDTEEIEENIIGLYTIGDWCFNHSSFVSQQPSRSVIKVYSDIKVREISIFSIHQLIASSPAFFQLGALLERGVERLHYFENANNAREKYNLLISKHPELFQAFPLKMIASYLKIAPETMSRLRAKN